MQASYFLYIQVFIIKCRKVKVNRFRVGKHKKFQLQSVDVCAVALHSSILPAREIVSANLKRSFCHFFFPLRIVVRWSWKFCWCSITIISFLWKQVLELTQKYCEEREIPFPKIEFSEEDEKKPKECYMFVDDNNPKAPIVIHFPLVNDTFQKYKAPGEQAAS